MRLVISSLLLATPLASVIALPALAQAPARLPVRSPDDLPRHSYPVAVPAAALLTDEAAVSAIATRLKADTRATLAAYDITDQATLRTMHRALLDIALLEGDVATARAEIATLRDLQDKESNRLRSGVWELAWLDALSAGPVGSPAFRAAFREKLAAALATMPWSVVGRAQQEQLGTLQATTPALMAGLMQEQYGDLIQRGRAISGDLAPDLIDTVMFVRLLLPLKEEIVAALDGYVTANRVVKPDIWAARAAVLPAGATLTPVAVSVWDTGVDASLFAGQLWTNPRETENGRDDDGNGYVDDLHGINYDAFGRRQSAPMYALKPDERARLDQIRLRMQGLNDQQAGIRSEAAADLLRYTASATPAAMAQMFADLETFGTYGHGTHVAGIVAAGNPAVRLVANRFEFAQGKPPRRPTEATAAAWAQMYGDSIAYMRAAGVRVVNMSWSVELKTEYEDQLEANGVPVAERAAEARRLFAIDSAGLVAAIRATPDVLFVAAAGNDNDSADFIRSVPASIDAPNMLTVAAVDQAGDPTTFTSGGASIDLAASGFQVESYVPGGTRQAWSGTSMAAPQVVNTAAKLWAINPRLTVAEVRAILLETATPGANGLKLLHPAAALARVTGASSAR